MLISEKNKILFIHIPRTGGTSIRELLHTQIIDTKSINLFHDSARTLPKDFFLQYDDYLKFAFVRNPWDRLLSWYSFCNADCNVRGYSCSFDFFIANYEEVRQKMGMDKGFHFLQIDYLMGKDGHLVVDEIGRFEDFTNEVLKILKIRESSTDVIPRINGTGVKNYRKYYSKNSRQLVDELCKKDIEYFGYEF